MSKDKERREKRIHKTRTIKSKIFKGLEEKGYLNDTEVAKICGGEPNWSTIEEYKRQWNRLKRDRDFFEDKEITHAHKGGKTRAMVDTPYGSYIVGKEFFDEIIKDMVIDNSRPDLKMKMYRQL